MIITLFFSKFSLIWLPYAILVLWIMGYGLFSFLVSLGFIYPKLDWDDPRRMANKKAGFPNLLGSLGYSLAGMLVADITFVISTGAPHWWKRPGLPSTFDHQTIHSRNISCPNDFFPSSPSWRCSWPRAVSNRPSRSKPPPHPHPQRSRPLGRPKRPPCPPM
jgi:hypothetical protein